MRAGWNAARTAGRTCQHHTSTVWRNREFYSPTGSPPRRLAPSRASVLTGRHFWELKQGAFIQAFIPKEYPIVTRILAENGYQLGHTGKAWGPGSHPDGIPSDSIGKKYKATISNPPEAVSPTDYAANFDHFLKDRNPGQPFFFWAGVTEPHAPYGKHNYKRLEKEFGVKLQDVSLPPHTKDTLANRKKRAGFLYEICYVDRHLGRMLASLEALGELDNTMVVVTSDNGTALLENRKHHGKASPYDYGVHEPLAIMWPSRVPADRTVTDFVSFADFAPTFLEAAGIAPPDSMTGRSILSLLESKESGRIDPQRNSIVTGLEWHGEFDPVSRSSRTIRDDRYAYLVRYHNVDAQGEPLTSERAIEPASEEFYDLESDPWQQKNLVDDPAYVKEIKRLADQLREVGLQSQDPRVTGEMDLFRKTRQYVQMRKRMGYNKAKAIPFE